MKTLNNLKYQFGQILSREELKGIIGGVEYQDCMARCYCSQNPSEVTYVAIGGCDSCEAINHVGVICNYEGETITSDCQNITHC